MKAPLLSVVMPVYNAAKHLREAIDSILIQTFEDFEFIIIDDGSTDSTKDIVRSYVDPRIRFYENEKNLGISETLNRGIKLASCELIARMDADDISYPSRLRKQYDYMISHPDCALLSTWARVITEDKKFVRLERFRSKFYYYNLTFECWMYHPTVMFRKQPVEAVGMYSMRYSEDFDLFWKLSTAFEIGNLQESLLDYRLSSTSLHAVSKRTEYDIANEQNVLRNIRYYLGDNFNVSPPVLECLRHNFTTATVEDVLVALRVLTKITDTILQYANPNLKEEDIRAAHYYKRNFMITQVCNKVPWKEKMDLLMKAHAWDAVREMVKTSVQWRIKKLSRVFG